MVSQPTLGVPVDIIEPLGACEPLNDPPPPYPSRRSRGTRTSRRRTGAQEYDTLSALQSRITQVPSTDSHSDGEALVVAEDPETEPTETTPFLSPSPRYFRPRSVSHSSTIYSSTSAAPSLAQTLVSLFQDDDGECDQLNEREPLIERTQLEEESADAEVRPRRGGILSGVAWRRYFRPMSQIHYYKSLLHLYILNFPYALAAWVYLFVFTLTGTTLLLALPLGAVFLFVDLIGARAFARGELFLQWYFHRPLAYPPPYPPRPIFSRLREASVTEIEAGTPPGTLVPERSFYKNTYSMFTDPTSYQALFYFIVVKPAITLTLTLALLVIGLPALLFPLTNPAALRAIRHLATWQANVAIEGLYLAVR
ncbi:hypothetical protein FISHEDRAFT_32936 [Fistulina hepatica ATCC 64428]|uniref:Uncharacterized protein n=1 Tax=Fistulina hepatica ATCC 64428 TaxID=1128425 RepID=A0A0D7APC2_9AGAR|nr:hypothetical protein FISHEDRAFT_32936 [Fistulina hepatica ATCC 64428]